MSDYVQTNSTILGNVDERGLKHTRTRMVAVHRESAGDISPRQIEWNGSERIESSAFWSSNPSIPHCCRLFIFFHPRPLSRLLRFYLAHRCLSDRTPDTIFPFLPRFHVRSSPDLFLIGRKASSASVYRAHDRSTTLYDAIYYFD